MISHLITGGCSFSSGKDIDGWTACLTRKMLESNPNLTYEHTGYYSQGQELIQKKIMLASIEAMSNGIKPEEILVTVMWSGTFRKAWYIDNPDIINRMVKGWPKFHGGMCSQFLDLKNNGNNTPDYFQTANGTKFNYNPNGGWYFTVDGSDCQLEFVQDYYLLDKHPSGVGKVHSSLENIIMLQNFCKLHGIKLVQQFFMDFAYQDIEDNKNHQLINYLYKQLDLDSLITIGMFEHLHSYIGIERKKARYLSHDDRKKLNANNDYFHEDGFHPGEVGSNIWCNDMLFPFLKNKGIIS